MYQWKYSHVVVLSSRKREENHGRVWGRHLRFLPLNPFFLNTPPLTKVKLLGKSKQLEKRLAFWVFWGWHLGIELRASHFCLRNHNPPASAS
jgi:hypothetical protein